MDYYPPRYFGVALGGAQVAVAGARRALRRIFSNQQMLVWAAGRTSDKQLPARYRFTLVSYFIGDMSDG